MKLDVLILALIMAMLSSLGTMCSIQTYATPQAHAAAVTHLATLTTGSNSRCPSNGPETVTSVSEFS